MVVGGHIYDSSRHVSLVVLAHFFTNQANLRPPLIDSFAQTLSTIALHFLSCQLSFDLVTMVQNDNVHFI